jgi:hypothetical protein
MKWVFLAPFLVWAGWVNASQAMVWATAARQPAGQASAPILFHVSAIRRPSTIAMEKPNEIHRYVWQ